jgi:hypothetical protein
VPRDQFAVLDSISEREVANDCQRNGQAEKERRNPNVGVGTSSAAKNVDDDERHNDVADGIPKREHQRQRVQPALELRPERGNDGRDRWEGSAGEGAEAVSA